MVPRRRAGYNSSLPGLRAIGRGNEAIKARGTTGRAMWPRTGAVDPAYRPFFFRIAESYTSFNLSAGRAQYYSSKLLHVRLNTGGSVAPVLVYGARRIYFGQPRNATKKKNLSKKACKHFHLTRNSLGTKQQKRRVRTNRQLRKAPSRNQKRK